VDIAVIDSGHISDQQIVDLAVKSQVEKIVLSHLYRELNPQELQQSAQTGGYQGNLVRAEDLMEIEF